jgi:ferritin
MFNQKINDALNDQIARELYSSYLYLAMSAYSSAQNLKGCAHWLRLQADEERGHAMKMFDFVHERGGRVTLQRLDAPPAEWPAARTVFEEVARHEHEVTGHIDRLYELARQERDHASEIFLQWFVSEQVEEEANAAEIVQQLQAMGGAPHLLYMLDRQLGKRGGK